MQAYEGYYEDGHFYPTGQAARISGRRRAFITILDEPAQDDSAAKNAHAEAWREFLDEIRTINDELISEFERVKFRETEI